MLQLSFTPFPVIKTKRLLLRKLTAEDAPEIFFLRSDARVLKYINKSPAKNLDEAKEVLKKLNGLEEKNDGVTWGITLENQSALIGTICYWNIQKQNYRAEIGYVLHPEHHKNGIMDEAIKAVISYGFDKMKLHSIEAHVNPANDASIKLLEKNNLTREAYFRENYFFEGIFLDTAVYSLLAE